MSINYADTTYRAGRAPRAQAQPAEPADRDWDAPIFFADAGLLDPLDDMLQPGALLEETGEKFVKMYGGGEDLDAQIDGAQAELASGADDVHRATVDLANGEAAELPASQISRLRAKLDRAKQRHADASKRLARLIAARETSRNLLSSSRRYIEGKRTFAPDGQKQFDITIVEVDLPEGDPVDIITVQRTELTRLRAERVAAANASIPLDDAKARSRAYVASRGRDVDVSVNLDGPTRLRLPTKRLDVPTWPDGRVPQTIDVEGLLCRYMPDQLLADIERNLDEEYAGIELTLTPHEQHRKLKEIDRAILEAERIEAAAVWQALESHADVSFRPDTDVRALLGVA